MRFSFGPLFYFCWAQFSTSRKHALAVNGNTNRDTLTHVGGTLHSATSPHTRHNNGCIATRMRVATLPKELTIVAKSCTRKVIQPGACGAHVHADNYELEAMVRTTSMIALTQPVNAHAHAPTQTMCAKRAR